MSCAHSEMSREDACEKEKSTCRRMLNESDLCHGGLADLSACYRRGDREHSVLSSAKGHHFGIRGLRFE